MKNPTGSVFESALPSQQSYFRNLHAGIAVLCLLFLQILCMAGAAHAQSAPLAKGAIAVDAYNNLAATADRSGAVRLFDATTAAKPVLLSTVTVPRELTGVALAGQYLLVSGQGGVQILDISNPKSPVFANTVALESETTVVKAAGNLGYAAFGATVVLFDIPTGTVLDRRDYSTLPVNDLALSGDYLYVLSAGATSGAGFQIAKLPVQGSLGQPVASWNSPAGASGGRMSLYAGDDLLYVGSALPKGSDPLPGLEVIEDLGTSFQLKGAPQPIDARTVRPSGLGLLAYTGAAAKVEGESRLGVLDIYDPSNTAKVLHVFDTVGAAGAVTLYHGYAYVAAGVAGLQVVPYVAPNGLKESPILSLSSNVVAETPEAGNLVRLTAKVAAADQIRKVDFFLNGQKVASDGDYPFEYRYHDVDADVESGATVYACAEDIDGNTSCTEPAALNPKKKTGLQVIAVTPTAGGHSPRSAKLAISAQFSLPLDATSVLTRNVTLVKVSKTSAPSTAIPLSGVSYQSGTKSIAIQPKSPLASGSYKVTLSSAIKSSSGGTMASDYTWVFDVDPGTVTWVAQVGGNWNVGSNWSTGAVPETGDAVTIAVPNVAVTIGSGTNPELAHLAVAVTDQLVVAGGNLEIESGGEATIHGNLSLSSGTVGGAGTIVVSGSMDWTGGAITGPLEITTKATMSIVTPNVLPGQFYLSGGSINNSGTVSHSWVGTGYGFYVYNGGTINNLAGGVWNLTSDVLITSGDSTANVFNNAGTFNKSAGTATTTWNLAMTGAGAINILSGTMSLGGAFPTNKLSGPLTIATGTTFSYGQGGTLADGAVSGHGTLVLPASATIATPFSFAGTTDITAGSIGFAGPATLATLNQSGGVLDGAGPVTVTGTANWTGGAITGTLDVPAKAVLNVVIPNVLPGQFYLSGGVINNAGTVNHSWVGTGYGMYVYGGGTINNLAGGVWNLTSDVLISSGDSSANIFNNAGTFNKIGGSGTTNWSLAMTGAGSIEVLSGTLGLNGAFPTTKLSGPLAIATGTAFSYGQGGTLANGAVTGHGTLVLPASATIATPFSFAGTTDITGGTIGFAGPTTLTTLNESGGVLAGAGPLTVTGRTNWTGGAITGTLDIPAKAVLNIVTPNVLPGQFYLSGGVINNAGTVNHSWVGTGYGMYVYGGGMINNLAGAVWNLTSDVLISNGDSTATVFNNTGTFNKIGGTGNSNWSLSFGGSGAVNLNSGTLSLTGSYARTITGPIAIAANAGLAYGQGGTFDGSKVTGTGTLNFTASTTIGGAYSFTGTTDISSGTVGFNDPTSIATLNLSGGALAGAGPVTVTGTMDWTGGAITGTLDIPAKAVLNIVTPNVLPGQFYLSGGMINNAGTVNHSWVGTGYGMYVYGGGTINNLAGGVWNLTSDVLISAGDSSATGFNNAGTFNKIAGTGTSSWNLAMTGAGTIQVLSGTLSLAGAFPTTKLSGPLAIATGTAFSYGQGGTLANGAVTGHGALVLPASATIATPFSFAGTTDITGGTINFAAATTLATLNQSSGTLSGVGPVTVTGTMDWTGGAITGTLDIPAKAVLNIVTPNVLPGQFYLSGGVINNAGTVNHSWVGTGYGMYVYGGGTINNSGTWDIVSDVLVSVGDSSLCVFNNTGTFEKTGGTGVSTWGLPITGPGTIDITVGTINFTGFSPTSNISGPVTVATSAGLNYGQKGTFSAGAVQGHGTLTFSSQTNVTGAFSFSGTTQIQGGMVSFTGTATMADLNLMVSGGVSAAGVVTVSGELNWSGGSIGGTAAFNINSLTLSSSSSVTLEIGSGSVLNVTAKLDLEGNLTLSFPTSGYGPPVGTVIKAINFANNYLGGFGEIFNDTLSNGDTLTPDYSASGLAFTVTK
jgi:hypothetical protein